MFKFCKTKNFLLKANTIKINKRINLIQINSLKELSRNRSMLDIDSGDDSIEESNFPASNFAKSVNVPKTSFNERMSMKENEVKMLGKISQEFYREQLSLKDRKLWVTHDGPAFANGKPHLGIIYNKVIKDAVNRLKVMQGHKVNYSVGFDCYGVGIEDQVAEKMDKKEIKDVDDLYNAQFKHPSNEHKSFHLAEEQILHLRKKCKEHVSESILEQIKTYLRLGVMFDVNSVYSTMSKEYESLELEIFKQIYEKGLVYRDNRVIFWSAEEQRIIDHDDLEERSELGDCIVVKIPIKVFGGESKFLEEEYIAKGKKLYLLGFLTEPWKYVGIRGLAFNPNNNYCIVQLEDDYFICAYKRLPELCRRFGEKKPAILHMAKGQAFADILAVDPLFKRDLPIMMSKDISEFAGTGINILSPAHDFHSEIITRNYKITLEGYLDEHNYFTPGLGLFLHNTHFMEGNDKIISKLSQRKDLFTSWKFENVYFVDKNTSERITLRSTPSWFFKVSKRLKMDCFKELAVTSYYPDLSFEKRSDLDKLKYQPRKAKEKKEREKDKDVREYSNIVEELEEFDEWCISEINSWGIPIPYFVYKDSNGKILMNSEIIDHVKGLILQHGSDIWWSWPIVDLLPSHYKNEAYKLIKGKENFDSWFDSSISWFVVLFSQMSQNDKEVIIHKLNRDVGIEEVRSISSNGSSDTLAQVNRTKDALKDLNVKLKDFVIEKMKSKASDEESQNEEEEAEENEVSKIARGKSIKSLLPPQEVISHIKQKCQNYTSHNLFPADMIIEGQDQHADWFLQSLLTSAAVTNQSAFNAIKTHGFIQNSAGTKLSKSLKNFIDPFDVIDGTVKLRGDRQHGYGADTLRLFLLKNDSDKSFKLFEMFMEKAKSEIKLIRKIAKVCLGLLNDLENRNTTQMRFKDLNIFDQIIINEFIKFYSQSMESLEKYNFKDYTEGVINFLDEIFFGCYLDSVRHRIINLPAESTERRSHQLVLSEIFYNLVKMLTPITPFTCEDIYAHSTYLGERKKFAGLEQLASMEDLMLKFRYSFNSDLNFNVENLVKIKTLINKEIHALGKIKNDSDINRNQIEIIFTGLNDENEDSYASILLQTLGNNLTSFFGVATVFLSEAEYMDSKPEILRQKEIKISSDLPNSTENVLLKFKYMITKSKKHKCPRCLFFRCHLANKICEVCRKQMTSITPELPESYI